MKSWFLFAIGSALFSAAAAIGQKKALFKIDALGFSFYLALFNAVIVLLIIAVKGPPQLGSTEVLILLLKTLLGALAFWCVMISIKNFQLGSVLPLLVFTPALVALTAFLFLQETLSPTEIIGMALMLLGIYVIEIKEKNLLLPLKELFLKSKSRFVIYALLLFTISSVLDKLLISKYRIAPIDFILLQQLFAFFFFGIFFLSFSERKNFKPLADVNLFRLILLISVFTLLYRFLYIYSLKTGTVALALTVKRTSVLFAVIASRKIFNEGNTLRKAVATVLLLIGGYLVYGG